MKGPIALTLEPVADLVDDLASGPTAPDLVLGETIVERVVGVDDICEGIDGLVQHIDLGVEGGGGEGREVNHPVPIGGIHPRRVPPLSLLVDKDFPIEPSLGGGLAGGSASGVVREGGGGGGAEGGGGRLAGRNGMGHGRQDRDNLVSWQQ